MACTTTYHCDRCSERISLGDRESFKPVTGPDRHGAPVDLCSECAAAFKAWLGPIPGRKPANAKGTIRADGACNTA
jgi:hypothetical protein